MPRDERAGYPAAVLWDLDGTLVDTEPLWMAAEHDIARRHGAQWTSEDAMALVGNDLTESGRYIKERMSLPMSVREIVDELVSVIAEEMSKPITWRPGAVALLRDIRTAGIPIGLVTMSYRRIVEPLLPQLPEGTFDVVVTGDEVSTGKPHPEPYLAAARALGVDPHDCVAIEDSPTGAASAESAGCHVIVVPNHVPVDDGVRRTLVDTLAGMGVSQLTRIERPRR
ncbi:MAG: HAD family hydrolase [Nocardioidaceae bacterium]